MPWQFFMLLNISTFSLYVISQRLILRDKGSDPVVHAIAFQLGVGTLLFFYTLIFSEYRIPNLVPLIPNLILMIVVYTTANISLFSAYKLVDASTIGAFFVTSAIWVLIWSAVFLGEDVTMMRFMGTIAIILGVVVATWSNKRKVSIKGYALAALAACMYGSGFVNDAYMVEQFTPSGYLTFSFLLPGLTLLVLRPASFAKFSFYRTNNRMPKLMLICGLFVINVLAIFAAYQAGADASLVVPISQSSVIVTMILSYVFLKERANVVHKLLGSIVIIAGVFMLG